MLQELLSTMSPKLGARFAKIRVPDTVTNLVATARPEGYAIDGTVPQELRALGTLLSRLTHEYDEMEEYKTQVGARFVQAFAICASMPQPLQSLHQLLDDTKLWRTFNRARRIERYLPTARKQLVFVNNLFLAKLNDAYPGATKGIRLHADWTFTFVPAKPEAPTLEGEVWAAVSKLIVLT